MIFPRQNFDIVNRLMAEMPVDDEKPMRCLALGAFLGLAERCNITASEGILDAGASCRTMDEFRDLYLTLRPILEARALPADPDASDETAGTIPHCPELNAPENIGCICWMCVRARSGHAASCPDGGAS